MRLETENSLRPGNPPDPGEIGKTVQLYEAGVPLLHIRDILWHVTLSATDIYARVSTEAKRNALESAYTDIITDELPEWTQDPGLLDWLTNL